MAIPRKYQNKDSKWWHGKLVKNTRYIDPCVVVRSTKRHIGWCGLHRGNVGIVERRVPGGLHVYFGGGDRDWYISIDVPWSKLDLVEGE